MPDWSRIAARVAVRIKRVHAVMLSADIHDVMVRAVDVDITRVKHLAVSLPIRRLGKEQAEATRGPNIGRGKDGFIRIITAVREVRLPRCDIDLGEDIQSQRDHCDANDDKVPKEVHFWDKGVKRMSHRLDRTECNKVHMILLFSFGL